MHDQDFLSAQKQTGLRKIPQEVLDEYEIRANMLARDGVPKPLGPVVMCQILRHCKLEAPTALRPAQTSENVNWESVESQARIIVRRDPTTPRKGIFLKIKSNGCLDVILDGEATVREFGTRYCVLDEQWSDDPWAEVAAGREVSVLRGKREFDAKFVRVEDQENVRVAFKGGEQVVAKETVKLLQVA